LVYEEGNFEREAITNMLIPRSSKTILFHKPQMVIKKTRMYCTNCRKTNHDVETCRVKRKEDFVLVVFEVTIQQIKVKRPMRYSYQICGETGHKIIDCTKYVDMQNMFKNKGMKTTNKQVVVKFKVANPLVHIINANMAIIGARLLKNTCLMTKS
jgi:hypothetical protein